MNDTTMNEAYKSDIETLGDFVSFSAVDDAELLVGELFQRKFCLPLPRFPHHFVGFVRDGERSLYPVSYYHATDCGDLILAGGACSDNRVLRRLNSQQRERLRAYGGIYRCSLIFGLDYFRKGFPVIFVFCGDALSERVLRSAGFEPAGPDQLFAHWLQSADRKRRSQMIAKAETFMPF